MKTKLIFISFVVFITSLYFVNAQNKKGRTYKIWVELRETDQKYKGQLLKLKDSAIVIRYWQEEETLEIPIKKIKKLKFRRKGAIGMGAGIGAGTGIVVGIISGAIAGDDPPSESWFDISSTAEEKSAGGAVTLGVLGAAAGSVIGSIKKKFTINGTQKNYMKIRPDLNKFLSD